MEPAKMHDEIELIHVDPVGPSRLEHVPVILAAKETRADC